MKEHHLYVPAYSLSIIHLYKAETPSKKSTEGLNQVLQLPSQYRQNYEIPLLIEQEDNQP